jgi:nucleotide-binding universal stress UspA family protein
MGTHSRTALAHLLSSSVAETVVNHSRIPVLTYHFKSRKHKVAALPAGYSM